MPNPISSQQTRNVPSDVEMTTLSSTAPSAPPASVNETAAPQIQKDTFEWNVGRLYSHVEGTSKAKSWTVAILSTVLVLPLILTLIVDMGRRLAFSVGLVDGKSWSLIDKVGAAGQAVASGVSSVYHSIVGQKKLTLAEHNQNSQQAIRDHAEKLVNAYNSLNGGYFHTNSSFSSPMALNAEKEIARAQADLQVEVTRFVARNTKGTEDFGQFVERANLMVRHAISDAAGDAVYIDNKVERRGPRARLSDVAFSEFLKGQKSTTNSILAHQFVALARGEPDFSAGLARGVEMGVLTPNQAKTALVREVHFGYEEGLKTGIDEADGVADHLLQSAVQNKVVTEDEAVSVSDSIRPDVEVLAGAAARDVARSGVADAGELEVMQHLSQAADKLKHKKRLGDKDESRFLTAAKAQITKAKEVVAAEAERAKKEAQEIEAQNIAKIQKAADQTSLLNKFLGMLGLIGKKQEELSAQFLKFDALEADRQAITDKYEGIRNSTVTVNGQQMTVLVAAGEYAKAISLISNDHRLSPKAKQDKIRDLVNQGFSQQTIDKINELKILEPQLTQVIDQMATLSGEIDQQHEEIARLTAVYKVFRKNNLGGLEARNRKLVAEQEKRVGEVQRTLDQRFKQLAQNDRGFISRLRSEPTKLVKIDPQGNRDEVDALVQAFEKSQAPEQEVSFPTARPAWRRLWDATLGIPVNAVASRVFGRSQAA